MNFPLKIGQPRFLTLDEVLLLHGASIDMYGGSRGVLDEGKLEASLAMPRQGFSGSYAHEFPFGMAAAYAFHIAMNHPFADGNKRAAFAAMTAFLRLNGWSLVIPDDLAADVMLEMIAERRGKEWLQQLIESHSRPRTSMELREFFQSITAEELINTTNSLTGNGGNTPDEFAETRSESLQAIPMLRDWLERYNFLLSNPSVSPKYAESNRVTALTLIAIFRIAEDRGYEW